MADTFKCCTRSALRATLSMHKNCLECFGICEPGHIWNYGSYLNQIHDLGKT